MSSDPITFLTTYANDRVDHVDVAATSDGGFVLTWEVDNPASFNGESWTLGTGVSAYVQRFDAEGKAKGEATLLDRVSADSGSASLDASVAVGADGRIISAWSPDRITVHEVPGNPNYRTAYGTNRIEVRVVASNGTVTNHTVTVAGAEVSVEHVDIAATSDGGFVLTWETNIRGTVSAYVQRFDANGMAMGQASLLDNVSADSGSASLDASVAVGADGRIISIWSPDTVTVDEVSGNPNYTTAVGSNKVIIVNGSTSNQPPVDPDPDTPVVTPPTSVETRTSLTLPEGVLNVVATGNANISLTGNALDNSITGNVGKNTINGGAGSDKLNGGYGNDILTGGSGKDAFLFTTKLGTSKTDRKVNFDTVKDFSVKDDSIWLDNAVFKKIGKKGSGDAPVKMSKDFFTIGSKAKDKNDFIVYDSKTGVLSYDADGSGKGTAVEIATFSNKAKLTASDFFVV